MQGCVLSYESSKGSKPGSSPWAPDQGSQSLSRKWPCSPKVDRKKACPARGSPEGRTLPSYPTPTMPRGSRVNPREQPSPLQGSIITGKGPGLLGSCSPRQVVSTRWNQRHTQEKEEIRVGGVPAKAPQRHVKGRGEAWQRRRPNLTLVYQRDHRPLEMRGFVCFPLPSGICLLKFMDVSPQVH